jgi:hypothetical protein
MLLILNWSERSANAIIYTYKHVKRAGKWN